MAERILIKKYPNRRLYDTEQSTYVSLSQVADMIRGGRQVEVIDVKTKEDVTAFILTQVILEEARNKNNLLPVPLLHLIIQYGDNVLNEFFEKYLQQTITNYLAFKSAFDEQFSKWLDLGTDLSNLAQRTMSDLTAQKSFFDLFGESPHSDSKVEKDK